MGRTEAVNLITAFLRRAAESLSKRDPGDHPPVMHDDEGKCGWHDMMIMGDLHGLMPAAKNCSGESMKYSDYVGDYYLDDDEFMRCLHDNLGDSPAGELSSGCLQCFTKFIHD